MDPTKTRIWNADQLGLPTLAPRRGDETLPAHRRVPPSRASRAPDGPTPAGRSRPRHSAPPAVPARRSSSVPPPPPPPRRARASLPPPVPSTLTVRWSANANTPGPLASTRIMPIELLLPSGSRALPQPTAASAAAAPRPRLRLLKRIGGHVLLAALTVLAVALWKLPLRQNVSARSLQPSTAAPALNAPPTSSGSHADERALAPAPEDPSTTSAHAGLHKDDRAVNAAAQAPTAAARRDARESSPAEPSREPRTPVPEIGVDIGSRAERSSRRRAGKVDAQARVVLLQRQAVELVIGGDFAGAQQAYGALAREYPDELAFHEAARILAARRRK